MGALSTIPKFFYILSLSTEKWYPKKTKKSEKCYQAASKILY